EPWYAMPLIDGVSLSAFAGLETAPRGSEQPFPSDSEQPIPRWWTQSLTATHPGLLSLPGVPASAVGPGLDVEVLVAIGLSLCDALGYLHGQGLVHRDLKPANVMMAQGRALLVDFGLAVWSAGGVGRERLDVSHQAAGSLYWMAPEQLRG